MKIYEPDNFGDLPEEFWDCWLSLCKYRTIKYNDIPQIVRVGITNKENQSQLYEKMKSFNDYVFLNDDYVNNKYIIFQTEFINQNNYD